MYSCKKIFVVKSQIYVIHSKGLIQMRPGGDLVHEKDVRRDETVLISSHNFFIVLIRLDLAWLDSIRDEHSPSSVIFFVPKLRVCLSSF